jgi:hypothetical protein
MCQCSEMIRQLLQRLRPLNRSVRCFLFTITVSSVAFVGTYDMLLNVYLVRVRFAPPFAGLVNRVRLLSLGIFSVLGAMMGTRRGSRGARELG